jgi:hypothetical protein
MESFLPKFDQTAAKVVSHAGCVDGFTSGAMDAYRSEAKL